MIQNTLECQHCGEDMELIGGSRYTTSMRSYYECKNESCIYLLKRGQTWEDMVEVDAPEVKR